jgi:hypothetical protein
MMAEDTEERAAEEEKVEEVEEAAEVEEAPSEEQAEPQGAASETPEVDVYAVLRYCLALMIHQGWVHLGLRAAQGSTETKTDLPKAKIAIDTAALLYEQIKGVAAEDEKRAVDTELANLRINFAHRAGTA